MDKSFQLAWGRLQHSLNCSSLNRVIQVVADFQMYNLSSTSVAIPLWQSSHVYIGCRFVNESPSKRRYWCGKLSMVQLRCICRTSVFQWPRCQVDSIYGRRLLESWWFQRLGRQQANGALPSTGRPSGTVYQLLLCEHLTDHWRVQASSENILVWTLAIIDWRCCD